MENQNLSSNSGYPEKIDSEIPPSREKLKGLIQLLKESWRIYCLKIKTLLGIIVMPVGFSYLFLVLMHFLAGTSIKHSVWFSVVELIAFLDSLFLRVWAVPSLLYNLKENTGVR